MKIILEDMPHIFNNGGVDYGVLWWLKENNIQYTIGKSHLGKMYDYDDIIEIDNDEDTALFIMRFG